MPTMMNSPFNLEYKITYDELSPSLQDMFKSLQNQISDNRNEINNLNLRCDDIDDRIDGLEDRVDKAEANITYLISIKNELEYLGDRNGYPMMKRTIGTIEGKEYIEQWFCERNYVSGSQEQQITYSFPEPMDRVISILEFRSSSSIGWTDGWDYVTGDYGLTGSGVRIIYDSCHEHNRGTTLNRWIYVFGYKLTGEVPKPPEEGGDTPGGDTGATADKIEDLENRISKLEADIPIGTVRYVYSIPEGWIELNGQLVSRTEYSDLWSWANSNNLVVTEEQLNSPYSNNRSNKGLFSYGDNSTTFRLPDFRSRFIRGLDNGVGYDPDRLLGTEELPTLIPGYDENELETNTQTYTCDPDWSVVSGPASRFSSDMIMLGSNGFALNYEYTMCPDKERWGHFIYPSTPDPPNPSSSQIRCSTKFYDGTNTQINANMMFAASRPRNIALRAIIKYK